MAASSSLTVTLPADRKIVMTRVFDAPRELVFEAHSKAEHIRRWWGRRDNTMPVCEMDFRPGGTWRYVLRDQGGNEFAFRGEFREVVPPEHFTWTFEYEGMPGQIATETMAFEDLGGRTRLTGTSVYDSKEARDAMLESGMEQGAAETWDRLADYLGRMPGLAKTKVEARGTDLFIERVFDAPRALLWKAWTDPEHLKQWWGPRQWPATFVTVDLRGGGEWRYCMRGPDGTEAWGKGVYREIVEPERIVYLDLFTDANGTPVPGMPEMQLTIEFSEENGKTRVTSRAEYVTVEAMETVLAMGMIEGMSDSMDRLDEHLAAVQG